MFQLVSFSRLGFLLAFVLCGLVISSHAQTVDEDQLDALSAYLDTLAAHDQAMGSLCVLKGDQLVLAKAFGSALIQKRGKQTIKISASPDNLYRIGSITKTYTATLILKLVEQGKLSLDDNLAGYFPQVPNAKEITIRQLLNHQSGIYNFTNDQYYLIWKDRSLSREKMLENLAEQQPDGKPGESFSYSNSNYVLLGYLIEDLTQQSYADVLNQYVLSPLSLKATSYGEEVSAIKKHVQSYIWSGSEWVSSTNAHPSVPSGAGAISATAEDVARFYRGLFEGKILSDESLATLKSLSDNGVGMGIFSMPRGSDIGYGHTGGIDGFRSQVAYWPSDSIAICFLGNGVQLSPNEILVNTLSVLNGGDIQVPDFNAQKIEPVKQELEKLVGVYTSPDFPLDIEITAQGSVLYAQATGQGRFAMDAFPDNIFRFDAAGITMKFTGNGDMLFNQGGGKLTFTKKD